MSISRFRPILRLWMKTCASACAGWRLRRSLMLRLLLWMTRGGDGVRRRIFVRIRLAWLMLLLGSLSAAVILVLRRWGFSGPWNLLRRVRTAVRVSRRITVRRIGWSLKRCLMGGWLLAPALRGISWRREL